MTLSALGIFSAAGAGGVLPSYELISTTILGSSQPSVTFSNLANFNTTYRHLQVRVAASGISGGGGFFMKIRFNGDTPITNYWSHFLRGTGSAVNSFASGGADYLMPLSSQVASSVLDVLDAYSTTKNKTVRALSGTTDGSTNSIILASAGWTSTASITSLTLSGDVNFTSGSRFSLYGIRG